MTKPFVVVVARGLPSPGSPLLGRFELDQAQALRAAGHPVVVASLDVRSLRRRRRLGLSRTEIDGLPVVQYAVPLGALPAPVLVRLMGLAWRRLYRAVRTAHGRPDVIHAHFTNWGAAVVGSGRRAGDPPVVLTEHSSKLMADPIEPEVLAVAERAMAADRVLAVSGPLARVLDDRFGVGAQVVGDVIDIDTFVVEPRVPQARVRVVSCGNLIARKRMDLLIRAFHRAFEGRDDVELQIVGDGPDRDALQGLITGLGLDDRVQLLGALPRTELAALYRRSDVFALLSTHETFGVVWAEAMSAGLPVLASRAGGPEDFVTVDTGVFLPSELPGRPDVEGAATALRRLVDTRANYDPQVVRAVVTVRFSPAAIAEQLGRVYAELL